MNEQQFQLIRNSLTKLQGRDAETSEAFYRRLFQRAPELRVLFRDSEAVMHGKFVNMLAVFGHAKRMEKLLPALSTLGIRHGNYGAKAEHFTIMGEALLGALADILGEQFTPDVEYAWRVAYAEIADCMKQNLEEHAASAPSATDADTPDNLLERIGGREVLERVHRRFYREIFDDKWLGKFFWGKDLETLVMKQTDFMLACLGGPNHYRGETPAIAHMHMFVTDEIFDVRQAILRKAIEAENLPPEVVDGWLQADGVFRSAIVKQTANDCVMRCLGQMPIIAEKPVNYRLSD